MPFAREHAKTLRLGAGVSASVMGREVGADGRTIRRWEAGDTEPPLSAVGRMARRLGVPLDELYLDEQHDRSVPDGSTVVGNPEEADQAATVTASSGHTGG